MAPTLSPNIRAGQGTTAEMQAELTRLEQELAELNQKCTLGEHGPGECSAYEKEYDENIKKLRTRIANRGDSKLPDAGVTLFFNGKNLMASSGKIWKAVSGAKNDDGVFRYSSESQREENSGPIPEGDYWIDPSELNNWSSRHWFGNKAAWGSHSMPIHPFNSTHTFGRGGFFIHGGDTPGSIGCIDLTDKIGDFAGWVKGFEGKKIILKVRYPSDIEASGLRLE